MNARKWLIVLPAMLLAGCALATGNMAVVTYDLNGGTLGQTKKASFVEKYDMTETWDLTRYPRRERDFLYPEGTYAFAGWSETPVAPGSEAEASQGVQVKDGKTYYAVWKEGIKISFDIGEGTFMNQTGMIESMVPLGESLGQAYAWPDVPQSIEKGYCFGGFYLDDPSDMMEGTDFYSYVPEEGACLHAVYLPSHTVTFDANGGSLYVDRDLSSGSMDFVAGKPVGFSLYPVTQDGTLAFAGWSFDETSNSVEISGAQLADYVVDHDVTLYAKYTSVCVVTLHSMEGYFINDSYQEANQMEAHAPKGFPFGYDVDVYRKDGGASHIGWALEENGEIVYGADDIAQAVFHENTHLYAVFGGEGMDCAFAEVAGKRYWYENGVVQGTVNDPLIVFSMGEARGREIFDDATDSWYWLDASQGGAMAQGKEVWMPYVVQGEPSVDGKWVRYDKNGKMVKGWYTVEGEDASLYPGQEGNTYYYDPVSGAMLRGDVEIEGKLYHLDSETGALPKE